MTARSPFGDQRGVTLAEITVLLAILSTLTAALTPFAARALETARLARAMDDVKAIRAAIKSHQSDVNNYRGFTVNGGSQTSTGIDMLVSDGDTPVIGGGDARWDDPVRNAPALGLITDFLERHLVTNNPFGDALMGYPTSGGNNFWRGAYLTAPVNPDPWGNRYAVNTRFLRTSTRHDVVVLSAGPDEAIDSAFEVDGMYPAGDDVMVVIARDNNTPVP